MVEEVEAMRKVVTYSLLKGHKFLLNKFLFIFMIALSLFLGGSVTARAINIDFEGLNDLDPVTDQFAGLGVTFTNATCPNRWNILKRV